MPNMEAVVLGKEGYWKPPPLSKSYTRITPTFGKNLLFNIKRSKADILFSLYIRTRDKWTCQRCFVEYPENAPGLHCSHFWGRGNRSVRFDPENAIAACFKCHQVLGSNPQDHRDLFLKRLGEEKYDALGRRARTPAKVDEVLIAIGLKMLLEKEFGITLSKKRVPLK